MKNFKKIVALLMAIVIFALVPMSANAALFGRRAKEETTAADESGVDLRGGRSLSVPGGVAD